MLTRRISLTFMSGAVLSAALPISAYAHRQKTTLSTVDWDAETGMLNVIHSFHIHDAETALAAHGIIDTPDLTSLKARAKLALYTAEKFSISANEENIDLEILGSENEGRTVYVYQQAKFDTMPSELTIMASILRDIIPGQLNNVDVTIGTELRSIQFKDGDSPKKVLA